jgi:hypothetical protein
MWRWLISARSCYRELHGNGLRPTLTFARTSSMALGIACVPFLTMSLAQWDWTQLRYAPSSAQSPRSQAPPLIPVQWELADAEPRARRDLARYLTTEFAGQVSGMQFGLMSTERPACLTSARISTWIKSPIRPVDLNGIGRPLKC